MTKLVTVRLHGPLAVSYGPEHRFAISTPREAIAALDANFPGFRRDFLAIPHYGLLADGDWRDETNCQDVANAPISGEVDICPMIEGRIFAPLLSLTTALVGTGVAATVLAGAIQLGLLVGASLLLTPKPKQPTGRDGTKNENYIFSGPENVTEQGVPVPVVYGRCFVGSVVVSAGLEVAENLGTSTGNNWVWNQMAAASSMLDMSFDDVAVARAALYQEPPSPPAEPTWSSGRTYPRWTPRNA